VDSLSSSFLDLVFIDLTRRSPTAGEVPIVQAMLALGVGVGPSAALLMTLAPVSLPSLVMAKRVFSLRTLLLVAASVVVAGITAGLLAVRLEF
jgi:uncharacterized membrane protein YraQ (UPF0718 family)